MMTDKLLPSLTLAIVLFVCPLRAGAQVRLRGVAHGLEAPVGFVQVPSDPTAQVILEHAGRIRLLKDGVLQHDFLDLRSVVKTGNEWGLLGLAFAPDYGSSGRLFVSFIDAGGHTVVARFNATNNLLHPDPASRFDLVWPGGTPYIPQPDSPMHKGGNIAFGPDGYLYIGLGDGESGDDPSHRAQDSLSLLGKMLRIDVGVGADDPEGYDVPSSNPFVGRQDVLPEIWAFGFRNPWRWSFDDPARGGTGALIIADVGQDSWEEVNYEPGGAGGRNYGWRNREGTSDHVTTLPAFSGVSDPTFQYSHEMGRSIIGGFVYRGEALGAEYRGRYFFADFMSGGVWALDLSVDAESGEGSATGLKQLTALGLGAVRPSSFGVDAAGELYLVNYAYGIVSRFEIGEPDEGPGAECPTPDPFESLGGGTCINRGWTPPGFSPQPQAQAPPVDSSNDPPAPTDGTAGNGSGCAVPDPFTSMGSGLCVNGGWLPAGPAAPGPSVGSPGPDSPPAEPPSPAAPTTDGSCQTPDPFASIGGGRCANGGWLPAGAVAPGPSAGSPGPNMPPAEPPSPTAPTTDGNCQTPDPFTSMGGGRCVNGGWLPAAAVPSDPSGGSSGPDSPPAEPSPTAPTTEGNCQTPDPFASMGGGRCVNGGWLPAGAVEPAPPGGSASPELPPADPLPGDPGGCSGPDPFAEMEMIKGVCVGGGWIPVPR